MQPGEQAGGHRDVPGRFDSDLGRGRNFSRWVLGTHADTKEAIGESAGAGPNLAKVKKVIEKE